MSDTNRRIPFSKDFEKISQNIFFVLVEPRSAGNIGATARALKTTGFKNLVLVNPRINKNNPETYWMAHQSRDILDKALIVSSFDEAIKDKHLVIATTQRKRHFKFPLYTPTEITGRLYDCALAYPCAIIFGREHAGLTNEELIKCHVHSTIVTATFKPSLNIAQAVMIYAYTFFSLQHVKDKYYKYDLAAHEELEKLYLHLKNGIQKVGFIPRDNIDNFVARFKRIIGRSMAEKRDIKLLHKLLQIFEKRIEELESKMLKGKSGKPLRSLEP
jgi:tRNA (cytidine32/uridine32-2'-O)-methyltransferase